MDLCEHLTSLEPIDASTPEGCGQCLASGDRWVHLRLCMTCGQVGCCDSSPNRHASAHAREAGHPVVQSYEKAEDWAYCYPDRDLLEHVPQDLRRPAPSWS